MIIAAAGVSVLAAVIMIWFAGVTGSVLWSVVAGLLAALLASLIIGLLRRDVFGPAQGVRPRGTVQSDLALSRLR
jgi:hypothetical protein